ncbi:MAG: NAD(P)/FAD-dependent oxidoreductase [Verrucomicrobia bacterium]|nr:NAD(P)/FAD-dependent oxidoreductase [Verrucomicrobiota bacterium]
MRAEVAIVGAGPAGIFAARAAAGKAQVLLLDDNIRPGGQIWRRNPLLTALPGNVTLKTGVRVLGPWQEHSLLLETPNGPSILEYDRLILATGARELFLPFKGWTLPNVIGAGALQALIKEGWNIRGKRIVIAGTGPLLLAVAALARKQGGKVLGVLEQAPANRVLAFACQTALYPSKAAQAIKLGSAAFLNYRTNSFVVEAIGNKTLTAVACQIRQKQHHIDCDIAAVAYGLVPNNELAVLLRCETRDGYVVVDHDQRSTVANLFAAGEITGIGGVEKSMIEGEIAGLRSTGQTADHCWRNRNRSRQFVKLLEKTFRLSPALKKLATDDTILCRCEDVSFGEVKEFQNWRLAKLQRRIGMGPCQGRVCGPAFAFLCGNGASDVEAVSIRPPVFATHLQNLLPKENENL